MKVATWNVNSVRRRLPLLLDWLAKHEPDVMCLQETKVQDNDFPLLPLQAAGYHVTFRGKKAYNGVATLTRTPPEYVLHGFRNGADEEDDRVLQTVIQGVSIVNTYVPQGFKINTDKYAYKLEWFRRAREYFDEQLDPSKPAIWLGDLNVAPEPIDVYHPDRRVNDVDFHIDARNAYAETVAWGFTDVFRQLHPDRVQYTYWDYFRNALQNNWGWRIDHILATAPLAKSCRAIDVDMEPRYAASASDHTVVWAEFDLGRYNLLLARPAVR
ncbi:MAG TPA: exodeoxyribonuclease III [Bryobacteraceae bacterium]|nr:exodeoxyribonuclease III [Bryobacteraceae bacterium]